MRKQELFDEVMNRLPSQFVEPKYNWLGEPDIRQNFWSDAVMPMLQSVKEDKLHAVISNLKSNSPFLKFIMV